MRKNIMEYLPGMEEIESDLLERVLEARRGYDAVSVTVESVEAALHAQSCGADELAALLSPVAAPLLEKMAAQASKTRGQFFGNSVALFTPLYIANYCENGCVYCGFNCMNKIRRGKLTKDEIHTELEAIAKTGLREILLLTGESRKASGVDYIGEAVGMAAEHFSTVGIEVYPLNSDEYAYLRECGADFVSVYQETYDTARYSEVHPFGGKRVFPYRFHSQERAIIGGVRGVAFGSLLGLADFRRDAYAAGVHALLLQKKYPAAEISFSFPRLRPFINNESGTSAGIGERELLQVMLAYRIVMPFAGITISTRERAGFRDKVLKLAATKISAGVSVGVGGHEVSEKGDEQFIISDPRSVADVLAAINEQGMQPVFTDYVRV